MDDHAEWYIDLCGAVCAADTDTFLSLLNRIDARWLTVLECCERRRHLDRQRDLGALDKESYLSELQRIMELVARAIGKPMASLSIDRVYDDYLAALRKYASRIRSWHGFGVAVDPVVEPERVFERPLELWNQIALMDKKESVMRMQAIRAHAAYLRRLIRLAKGCADWLTLLRDNPQSSESELKRCTEELEEARTVLRFVGMDEES